MEIIYITFLAHLLLKILMLNSHDLITNFGSRSTFFSHIKRFHRKNECNFGVENSSFSV